MNDFKEGDVVIIVHTLQAGSIVQLIKNEAMVLLRNGDLWRGPTRDMRIPQDQADLDACVLDVERFKYSQT